LFPKPRDHFHALEMDNFSSHMQSTQSKLQFNVVMILQFALCFGELDSCVIRTDAKFE
jgi:hypothetical protein